MTTEPFNNPNDDNQDSGLRCLSCEYNLTGVESDRCPECGEAFDREYLLAVRAGKLEPLPVPIWDKRDKIGFVRAYVQTALQIWFRPRRFVETFPLCPDLRSSSRFITANFIVITGSSLFVALLWALPLGHRFLPEIVIPGIPIAFGAWIFAELFAGHLGLVPDSALGKSGYARWRGIMRFCTVDVLIINAVFVASTIATATSVPGIVQISLLLSPLLVWFHLLTVLRWTGRKPRGRFFDMLIIAPILAVFSFLFCACLTFLLGLVMSSFIRL